MKCEMKKIVLRSTKVKEIPRNKLKALKRLIFILRCCCFECAAFLGIDVNEVKFHELPIIEIGGRKFCQKLID